MRPHAYQRISMVDEMRQDILETDRSHKEDMAELAFAQVSATLAVAQATVELQAELEAIRQSIANLR